MSIYVCREPDAVGIIIEGIPVLTNLGNLAKACCFLLGLTYALNLEYPSKLSKTFEVFQTLFVGLDTLRPKPSPKFMTLKNCHCTWHHRMMPLNDANTGTPMMPKSVNILAHKIW
ncbi:hypothetical protein F2P79_006421 [Pimephales promelas]|nr:hypothetical protein F2P79_006421 [Pimephales promelas]